MDVSHDTIDRYRYWYVNRANPIMDANVETKKEKEWDSVKEESQYK